jgi:hypothetical protein
LSHERVIEPKRIDWSQRLQIGHGEVRSLMKDGKWLVPEESRPATVAVPDSYDLDWSMRGFALRDRLRSRRMLPSTAVEDEQSPIYRLRPRYANAKKGRPKSA